MLVLLDTNILIDAFAATAPDSAMFRIEEAIAARARYSVVTRIELLGWRGHTDDSRRATEGLLAQLAEVPLSHAVADETIRVRSSVSIRLPDAIIAASALVERLPLMTRNTSDFQRIPGLTLIDPFAA
jgi:predicted nucleic acid-binding protein